MAQVNATYSLEVDLNGDLGYGDANEDFSAYWKRITIDHGMSNPGDRLGRSATLMAVLNNASGRFSPEHASALSGFVTGRKCRLQMTYSATTVTLYEGRIDSIAPTPGANGSRECVIRCDGYLKQMQNAPVAIDVQKDSRTDEIAAKILKNAPDKPAMLTGWKLGDAIWSKLGTSSRLNGGVSSYANLDVGANTYDFAGDNFARETSVYAALKLLVESERGWLYEGRDGKINLWSRHHLVRDLRTAVDATLTDTDFAPLKYSYGERLTTACAVNYHPRRLDGIGIQLGYAKGQIPLTTDPVTVTIDFIDDRTGTQTGGFDLILPKAGFDFVANDQETGRGKDVSKNVTVSMKPLGNRVELTFYLTGFSVNRKAFIMAGARIRGTRLVDLGTQQAYHEDAASVSLYHTRRLKTIDAKLIEQAAIANAIARWEVALYKDPVGQLERIGFYANKSAALMAQARDRDIGDRIALTETQTGVAADGYFIVGKHIDLTPQNMHYEQWILEPAPIHTYWLLGQSTFSNLGTSARLGA